MTESACGCNCANPSKKVLSKKPVSVEEIPGAYCATITNTTYEITYACKECGQQWKETKVESKFE